MGWFIDANRIPCMRSKKKIRVLSVALPTLVVCCAFACVNSNASSVVPHLFDLTNQPSTTLQTKPSPAPARWRGLIGEYGPDNDILIIFEEDGKLCALFKRVGFYPLVKVSKNA